MNSPETIFSFENASFGYPAGSGGNILIRNFSGEFNEGEFIAVIGRNGTGKSTFLKSLARLIPLIDGNIFIKGKPISCYSASEYAGLMSFVSTDMPKVAGMTVKELVSLGRFPHTNWLGYLDKSDHFEINRAIELTGIAELKEKQLLMISDGERQRAVIARALAQNTPVIILDEPTAFLDLPNKYDLAGLLTNLVTMGKTIIISTHDTSIALRFPDKLLIINENIITSGSPEDQIINGEFSRIFQSRSFTFNKITAELEKIRENGMKIEVHGDDEMMTVWTGKALKRAGFTEADRNTEADGNSAAVIVKIFSSGQKNTWIVTFNDISQEFHSIYDLINFVKTNLYTS